MRDFKFQGISDSKDFRHPLSIFGFQQLKFDIMGVRNLLAPSVFSAFSSLNLKLWGFEIF